MIPTFGLLHRCWGMLHTIIQDNRAIHQKKKFSLSHFFAVSSPFVYVPRFAGTVHVEQPTSTGFSSPGPGVDARHFESEVPGPRVLPLAFGPGADAVAVRLAVLPAAAVGAAVVEVEAAAGQIHGAGRRRPSGGVVRLLAAAAARAQEGRCHGGRSAILSGWRLAVAAMLLLFLLLLLPLELRIFLRPPPKVDLGLGSEGGINHFVRSQVDFLGSFCRCLRWNGCGAESVEAVGSMVQGKRLC